MVKDLERVVKSFAEYDETTATEDAIAMHERLRHEIPRMQEVCETLTVSELMLIWYLRNSGCSSLIIGLRRNLEANYEAVQLAMKCRREMLRLTAEVAHDQ